MTPADKPAPAHPARRGAGRVGPGGLVVGVDVGGTFTDAIVLGAGDDAVRLAKVPTDPADRAGGVMAALHAAGVDLGSVGLLVHGTTATTNAVLERTLARTGLITTRGFRDVLELGRRTRPAPYGMTGTFVPVVPRDLRLEVDERLDARGCVVVPLDEAGTVAAAERLRDAGCEAVLVHFLHSYANPAHERRALELVRTVWPNDFVSAGHELLSESREFERGVTAAVNAAVRPLLERYLQALVRRLAEGGYAGELLVVTGNGGMAGAAEVGREAVRTVMSGPASGVMAAAATGRAAGRPDLVTFDMGGTSTDVALVRGGEAAVSSETAIEYGMPIHVPLVDVRTVGAGGGSIARVDAGGLLAVGPASAGSVPGPICYGRGGTLPTLSDANALLGRLDPGSFPGGGKLDAARDELERAFATGIGEPLGLDAIGAALATVRVANAAMADAMRLVSVSLGVDPRDFHLFAFGGAGPLHASAIARELRIPTVLVPARPGIGNALGCAVADLRHDFVDSVHAPLDALDVAALHAMIAGRIAEGEALVRRRGLRVERVEHRCFADMQFVGQTHVLRVPLDSPTPGRETLQASFEARFFERFRVRLPEIRAAVVGVAVSVTGVRAPPDLSRLIDPAGRESTVADALVGRRPVHFESGRLEVPVYRRERLPLEGEFEGPAIVEQLDTTTLVEPGDRVAGDAFGNLLITVGEPA